MPLIVVEKTIFNIISKLDKRGHKALLVGGCVRDAYLGIEPKDIDIEVYKISYNDLQVFLSALGKCDLVGKSFGVIKFHPTGSEMHYDFSVPRKESKIGIGHKSFEVTFDEDMTIEEAAQRRDITINALAYDPIENKIYDFFGGLEDLRRGTIRHTSEQFKEDSLRVLRVMQFSARFGFSIHPDTIEIIREILATGDYESLPKERLFEEFRKWAEKGVRHDFIFDFMRETNLIDFYPELKIMRQTEQDKLWHPEGNVETHTKMCLAEMDKIIARENITGTEKLILVMSILLHDVAKNATTETQMKNGRMTITSHGHEALGGEMSKTILANLGFHEELITPISNLIANHLSGVSISCIDNRKGKLKAVKRLSRRLAPATIQQLLLVMEADHNGRGGDVYKDAPGSLEIAELAKELNVEKKPYEYILMGRHLIEAGLKPSLQFGEILRKSYEAQESGEFSDLGGARQWLQNNLQQ